MTRASNPPASRSDDDGGVLRDLSRAIELQHRGRLDEAERLYAGLLARNERDPTVLINAGVLALARGDVATATKRLDAAAALVPANAIAHGNLGLALIHAGRFDEALVALDRALVLKPDFAHAHNSRGIALLRGNRREEARRAFERALALLPAYPEAALNLGELENQDGDASRSRAAFRRILERDPEHALARVGLAFGDALEGRLDESIASLERVVDDHANNVAAWQTLGAVRNWAWRHEAAEAAYRKAVALDAANRDARFGIASTLLSRGRYPEGLAAFETSRERSTPSAATLRPLPRWSGEALSGTLVLHGEQGLGDVVQFARFVPRVRERVSRVVVWLDDYWKPLAPLLATLRGVDQVIVDAAGLTDVEPSARASMLSLAHIAGVTPETLWQGRYLAATEDRIALWRSRVDASAALRVGLAWSVHARDDHGYVTGHKSIAAGTLAPLLDVAGVAFHSLQPGAPGDVSAFGSRAGSIAATGAMIEDFGDTAALIENLDLVITPDTAVAHVAGALDKPVWLLERFHGCWRWRLSASASPWYPSLRIFRQARFNEWSDVVQRVKAELEATVRAQTTRDAR